MLVLYVYVLLCEEAGEYAHQRDFVTHVCNSRVDQGHLHKICAESG